jgi:hypothetical protein
MYGKEHGRLALTTKYTQSNLYFMVKCFGNQLEKHSFVQRDVLLIVDFRLENDNQYLGEMETNHLISW